MGFRHPCYFALGWGVAEKKKTKPRPIKLVMNSTTDDDLWQLRSPFSASFMGFLKMRGDTWPGWSLCLELVSLVASETARKSDWFRTCSNVRPSFQVLNPFAGVLNKIACDLLFWRSSKAVPFDWLGNSVSQGIVGPHPAFSAGQHALKSKSRHSHHTAVNGSDFGTLGRHHANRRANLRWGRPAEFWRQHSYTGVSCIGRWLAKPAKVRNSCQGERVYKMLEAVSRALKAHGEELIGGNLARLTSKFFSQLPLWPPFHQLQ